MRKTAELWLLIAIAAKHHLNLFRFDMKQVFLNGNIWDKKIYVHPPDWWPEHVLHEYVLELMKSTSSVITDR